MGIGIDLGGTAIKGGIVSESGTVIKEISCKTRVKEGYPAILEDVCEMIKTLYETCEAKKDFVGIGVPGILSEDGACIISCPNLFLKNIPLKKDIEERLGIDVLLVNDATAAGIAESVFGRSQGKKDSMVLTLGTGIGGGLILNNRMITGKHGVASEVGHMIVGENFYNCSCGKNGCLETFSSATGLIRYCERALEKKIPSKLDQLESFDGKIIIDFAKEGDELALAAVERMAKYLGLAISNMNDLVDPGIFVIGGGLSCAGDFLLEKIRKATRSYLTYPNVATPEICLATYKNEAGIIGAANIKKYL